MPYYLRPVIALVCWAVGHIAPATAATIEVTPSGENGAGGTTIVYLSGTILPGDYDKLKALTDPYRPDPAPSTDSPVLLILNSGGGDFFEGVKIAEMVWHRGFSTLVEGSGDCISACAFIFLAGNYTQYMGDRMISRAIEPGARLGFHSPYNDLDKGRFAEGVAAIQQLTTALGTALPGDLLQNVLKTGPDDTFDIKYVGDLVRWKITLDRYQFGGIPVREALYNACVNDIMLNEGVTVLSDVGGGKIIAKNEELPINRMSYVNFEFNEDTFKERYQIRAPVEGLARGHWISLAPENDQELADFRRNTNIEDLYVLKAGTGSQMFSNNVVFTQTSAFAEYDEMYSAVCKASWSINSKEVSVSRRLERVFGEEMLLPMGVLISEIAQKRVTFEQ